MSQYNSHYLPFLGKYQIYSSYSFKTLIIAGDKIHLTQFIHRIENNDFIQDISNIRSISSNGNKLLNDGCIDIQSYEKVMVESFLGEVTIFIMKWGHLYCCK